MARRGNGRAATGAPQHLRVLLRLRPDNVVHRIRTQVRSGPQRTIAGREPPLAWAEMLGESERLLLRWPMAGFSECAPGGRSADLALRGHIPIPPGARFVRVVRDGVAIIELKIAGEGPSAELQWAPRPDSLVAGRISVPWQTHTTGADAFLRYSNDDGRTWMRIGGRSAGRPFDVNFDTLPGGPRCRLALAVTSECRTSTIISRRFRVAGSRPEVIVVSPRDGTVVEEGSLVLLQAAVARPLGAPASDQGAVSWHSSRDGDLGEGHVINVRLRKGTHRLTVTLPGVGASTGAVTVRVR